MYTKRKIEIKVKKENYGELMATLHLLKLREDGCVKTVVELDDTKETYELLAKSGLIEDWNIVEPVDFNEPDSIESALSEEIPGHTTVEQICEKLVWIMQSLLHSRKTKQALRPTPRIFREEVIGGLKNTMRFNGPEFKAVESFVSGYFGNCSGTEEIIKDFANSVRKAWFRVKEDDNLMTLTEKMFDVRLSADGTITFIG